MNFLNLALGAVLLIFAALQFNDPDNYVWVTLYGIPAMWCLLIALKPDWISTPILTLLLVISFVAALVASVWFWPGMTNWWTQDVWWEQETAREGIGAIIVLVAMCCVLVEFWRHKRRTQIQPSASPTRN